MDDQALITRIRSYWDEHIHDLEVATYPPGSEEFFKELDEYRFEKLHYLPERVNFSAYTGKRLLEVGCGAGIDLMRFARAGAVVTGIDLSATAISLARQYFQQEEIPVDLHIMNGEALDFPDDAFEVVYAHGVLQYTANPSRMVAELERVLRPGGEAILMVYNRRSWLRAISRLTGVALEHQDAPVYRLYTIGEFEHLLRPFAQFSILPERFPVPTRLHHGLKSRLYNELFVNLFNALPRGWTKPLGWHLLAFARKD